MVLEKYLNGEISSTALYLIAMIEHNQPNENSLKALAAKLISGSY